MRRAAMVVFAFAVTALSAAPVPKELKHGVKLEGTWKVESVSTDGKPAGQEGSYWTIDEAGMLTHHSESNAPAQHSNITFKYDPGTKAIDYTSVPASRNYPGIYELRGDTLKICFQLNDQTRPKTVGAGKDLNLWTFERVPPGEMK